jgi:hypothetical protein
MAAFLNHSCDPNCETDEENGRIWIFAARNIRSGEELCYDYNLYDGIGEALCNCGSPHCRGTMYSPREIRKRQREQAEGRGQARRSRQGRGGKGRRRRKS